MDQEIDLRPYIMAILRRWRLVLACLVGFSLIGGILIALFPRTNSANADVLIVPITSQVTLDTRFQTTNGNQATTPAAQRQALISLATSQVVAEQVMKELETPVQASTKGGTFQQVLSKVAVKSSSDLLQITISDPDPDHALKLAQAWGKAYENLVAEVYTRSEFRTDLLVDEITAAQQRYTDAQSALETFLKDGQIIHVHTQIANLNDLLDGSRQSQQLLYSGYLTRTRELDLILQDAQTLRDQTDAQGGSSFADSFASLLLRARTVDSTVPSFMLDAGALNASEGATSTLRTDLIRLIDVLTSRRDQMHTASSDLASAITRGDVDLAGLDSARQQQYTAALAALNSTYEQLQAKQNLLTQQRDLARDTLMLLQRKHDEQEVARSSPQIEVRFVSATLNSQPSLLSRSVLGGVSGGIVGLLLGILLALLLEVIIPAVRQLARAKPAQVATRSDKPSDRPILGD
ncbi:MAG: hypothetical protein HGA19_07345 [Oscillochloris sp.]|nr:hypothetical protein [Oscillochloris sp.]